jgi:hypothetical protein
MAMRKFRVLEKSYIVNRIVEEGEIVEYDGEPSANLELVDDKQEAKGVKKSGSDRV